MLFLVFAITTLLLLYGYPAWRIIPTLALPGGWSMGVWIAVAFLALFPLLPMILRFLGMENRLIDALSWVAFTSMGFFFLTFIFVAVRDLGWITLSLGGKLLALTREWTAAGSTLSAEFDPGRRQFLIWAMNVGLVSITGGLSAYGLFQARRQPTVMEVEIPIDNLPLGLQGLRIVQISDLHVGPTIKGDFVQQVVDQVNALAPDLVALTGDLVDGSVDYLSKEVASIADIKARYGRYFVTGNHEYYSGADHWLAEVDRLGFTCLKNEHKVVDVGGDQLVVAGVHDLHAHQVLPAHRSDVPAALKGAPEGAFRLLLAHQPGSIFAASEAGVQLQLSGHTHGGQLRPFDYAVAATHPYIADLHKHDDTYIYVNRGTGYWGPPLRLGIPSEITVLTLVARKRLGGQPARGLAR